MSLTEKRIEQIRAFLQRHERPNTQQAIAENIGIGKSHVGRLINANFELYKLWVDNKRYHTEKKAKESRELIEAHMKEHDVCASYACVALGFNQAYYSKLKAVS